MKKICLLLIAVIAACTTMTILAQMPGPAPTGANTPTVSSEDALAFLPDTVASIGEEKITKAEIIKEAKPVIGMMQARGQNPNPEQLKMLSKEIVEGLIEKKILLDLAAEDGFKPDPAKGEEEFKKLTEEIPEDQLKTILAQQGLSADDVKSRMTDALAIRDWMDKIAKSLTVSDEDTEKFYRENQERFKQEESVEASHILFRPEEPEADALEGKSEEEQKELRNAAKAKAKKEADDTLARLKQGEDFAKLAEELSDCPSGKREQGNLGEFQHGRMVKEFEDVAFALDVNELSDVVETQFGYHIIKTTKHNAGGFIPLAEVKETLQEQMQNQKMAEKIKTMLDEQKEKLGVKIMI